ncbi:unnamed protein product [Rodentolepis nana]|uniref:Mediator of RNA polymerase II transcription subunit 21 n=1 Tax=Rodentolepis nana TaxID=102285 RepID=A0A0R3T8I9_RODNA|nr:unnamed protein product [Rodentolepis nana]
MADRLTELQDIINLQAENLYNAIGVIQQLAQPSFFSDLNHKGRREKEWASNPELQSLLQGQTGEDYALKYAISIADCAKKIEILINSLPAEETAPDVQDEATKDLFSDYRKQSAKLYNLITKSFQTRLSKVRFLIGRISETQLLTRALENEVCVISFRVLSTLCPFYCKFSDRYTTTSIMDLMQPEIPEKTESDIYFSWLNFLSLCLGSIFFARLFGILLPLALPKVVQYVLPSCRASRAASKRRDSELLELRSKMSKLNMVDNFAAYSKLQRKVNSLVRDQNETDRSQLGITLVSSLVAQVIRYILHGILLAWLFSRTPTDRLTNDQLAVLKETYAFVGWLVTCIHYIPGWLITMLWISLCEVTSTRFLSMFQQWFETDRGNENFLQTAANFAAASSTF